MTLGGNVIDESLVPEEFFIPDEEVAKWEYEKGAKKIERTSKEGFKYVFSEGGMAFPDALDKPSRTIITGEGGAAASRFKHVIKTPSGRYRRLIPLELERLFRLILLMFVAMLNQSLTLTFLPNSSLSSRSTSRRRIIS